MKYPLQGSATKYCHKEDDVDLIQSTISKKYHFNPLPNNKIFGRDQTESICRRQIKFTKMTIFLSDRVENTVGKGENAGYQHFLLFAQIFPKPSSLGSLKVGIVW